MTVGVDLDGIRCVLQDRAVPLPGGDTPYQQRPVPLPEDLWKPKFPDRVGLSWGGTGSCTIAVYRHVAQHIDKDNFIPEMINSGLC